MYFRVGFWFVHLFLSINKMKICNSFLIFFSDIFFQGTETTSSDRMSVGFIGAGQLAHALVKGFTAAGEAAVFNLN